MAVYQYLNYIQQNVNIQSENIMITRLTINSFSIESKNNSFYVKGIVNGTHFESQFKWSGKDGVDEIKLKDRYFSTITDREFQNVCVHIRAKCLAQLEEKFGEELLKLFTPTEAFNRVYGAEKAVKTKKLKH